MGSFVFYILVKWAFSSVIARYSGPYFMFVSTKCRKTHIYSTNTLRKCLKIHEFKVLHLDLNHFLHSASTLHPKTGVLKTETRALVCRCFLQIRRGKFENETPPEMLAFRHQVSLQLLPCSSNNLSCIHLSCSSFALQTCSYWTSS